jgi:peroxiredoxin
MAVLPPGTRAPGFTLNATPDQRLSLSDLAGRRVILAFYPADWSPVCGDQMSLYNQILPEFSRRGAELLGLSVDGVWCHQAFARDRNLHFPLLADFEPKGAVAKLYNVWRAGDGFPDRALYLVDGEGVIRYAHVSPRLGRIPDIYELYHALSEITGVSAPTSSAEAPVGVNGHAGD